MEIESPFKNLFFDFDGDEAFKPGAHIQGLHDVRKTNSRQLDAYFLSVVKGSLRSALSGLDVK